MPSFFKKLFSGQAESGNVLGLQISHDYAACLVQDGKVVAAIAEERLNRKKHFNWDFDPKDKLALNYCLEAGGIGINDLDALVVTMVNYLQPKVVQDFLPEFEDHSKLHMIGHHQSHAASAFYCSGFDESAILIMDGSGAFERDCGIELESMYMGGPGGIDFLDQTYARHGEGDWCDRASLGWLYQAITLHIGFGSFDAGKTMGLAPYGKPGRYADLILMDEQGVRPNPELIKAAYPRIGFVPDETFWVSPDLPHRQGDEPMEQEHMDLAADLQAGLERAVIELANRLYEKTGSKNLCLAGGVALNCVANKKVLDNTPFEQVFIQPASTDDGAALGNALYGYRDILGRNSSEPMKHAYLGRTYSKDEIAQAIAQFEGKVVITNQGDIVDDVVEHLVQGRIIGWFQGGSEFGPRALGHRSIIVDPRRDEMKDTLNARVKHREGFRPFAPSVLEEAASKFFDLNCPSPFMLLAADTISDEVPAITHVDGTARVQTVSPEQCPVYYGLIKAFGERTGVPVLLNTSFNVAGEPIVETPADALRTFTSTAIDVLVLEDVLVVKK